MSILLDGLSIIRSSLISFLILFLALYLIFFMFHYRPGYAMTSPIGSPGGSPFGERKSYKKFEPRRMSSRFSRQESSNSSDGDDFRSMARRMSKSAANSTHLDPAARLAAQKKLEADEKLRLQKEIEDMKNKMNNVETVEKTGFNYDPSKVKGQIEIEITEAEEVVFDGPQEKEQEFKEWLEEIMSQGWSDEVKELVSGRKKVTKANLLRARKRSIVRRYSIIVPDLKDQYQLASEEDEWTEEEKLRREVERRFLSEVDLDYSIEKLSNDAQWMAEIQELVGSKKIINHHNLENARRRNIVRSSEQKYPGCKYDLILDPDEFTEEELQRQKLDQEIQMIRIIVDESNDIEVIVESLSKKWIFNLDDLDKQKKKRNKKNIFNLLVRQLIKEAKDKFPDLEYHVDLEEDEYTDEEQRRRDFEGAVNNIDAEVGGLSTEELVEMYPDLVPRLDENNRVVSRDNTVRLLKRDALIKIYGEGDNYMLKYHELSDDCFELNDRGLALQYINSKMEEIDEKLKDKENFWSNFSDELAYFSSILAHTNSENVWQFCLNRIKTEAIKLFPDCGIEKPTPEYDLTDEGRAFIKLMADFSELDSLLENVPESVLLAESAWVRQRAFLQSLKTKVCGKNIITVQKQKLYDEFKRDFPNFDYEEIFPFEDFTYGEMAVMKAEEKQARYNVICEKLEQDLTDSKISLDRAHKRSELEGDRLENHLEESEWKEELGQIKLIDNLPVNRKNLFEFKARNLVAKYRKMHQEYDFTEYNEIPHEYETEDEGFITAVGCLTCEIKTDTAFFDSNSEGSSPIKYLSAEGDPCPQGPTLAAIPDLSDTDTSVPSLTPSPYDLQKVKFFEDIEEEKSTAEPQKRTEDHADSQNERIPVIDHDPSTINVLPKNSIDINVDNHAVEQQDNQLSETTDVGSADHNIKPTSDPGIKSYNTVNKDINEITRQKTGQSADNLENANLIDQKHGQLVEINQADEKHNNLSEDLDHISDSKQTHFAAKYDTKLTDNGHEDSGDLSDYLNVRATEDSNANSNIGVANNAGAIKLSDHIKGSLPDNHIDSSKHNQENSVNTDSVGSQNKVSSEERDHNCVDKQQNVEAELYSEQDKVGSISAQTRNTAKTADNKVDEQPATEELHAESRAVESNSDRKDITLQDTNPDINSSAKNQPDNTQECPSVKVETPRQLPVENEDHLEDFADVVTLNFDENPKNDKLCGEIRTGESDANSKEIIVQNENSEIDSVGKMQPEKPQDETSVLNDIPKALPVENNVVHLDLEDFADVVTLNIPEDVSPSGENSVPLEREVSKGQSIDRHRSQDTVDTDFVVEHNEKLCTADNLINGHEENEDNGDLTNSYNNQTTEDVSNTIRDSQVSKGSSEMGLSRQVKEDTSSENNVEPTSATNESVLSDLSGGSSAHPAVEIQIEESELDSSFERSDHANSDADKIDFRMSEPSRSFIEGNDELILNPEVKCVRNETDSILNVDNQTPIVGNNVNQHIISTESATTVPSIEKAVDRTQQSKRGFSEETSNHIDSFETKQQNVETGLTSELDNVGIPSPQAGDSAKPTDNIIDKKPNNVDPGDESRVVESYDNRKDNICQDTKPKIDSAVKKHPDNVQQDEIAKPLPKGTNYSLETKALYERTVQKKAKNVNQEESPDTIHTPSGQKIIPPILGNMDDDALSQINQSTEGTIQEPVSKSTDVLGKNNANDRMLDANYSHDNAVKEPDVEVDGSVDSRVERPGVLCPQGFDFDNIEVDDDLESCTLPSGLMLTPHDPMTSPFPSHGYVNPHKTFESREPDVNSASTLCNGVAHRDSAYESRSTLKSEDGVQRPSGNNSPNVGLGIKFQAPESDETEEIGTEENNVLTGTGLNLVNLAASKSESFGSDSVFLNSSPSPQLLETADELSEATQYSGAEDSEATEAGSGPDEKEQTEFSGNDGDTEYSPADESLLNKTSDPPNQLTLPGKTISQMRNSSTSGSSDDETDDKKTNRSPKRKKMSGSVTPEQHPIMKRQEEYNRRNSILESKKLSALSKKSLNSDETPTGCAPDQETTPTRKESTSSRPSSLPMRKPVKRTKSNEGVVTPNFDHIKSTYKPEKQNPLYDRSKYVKVATLEEKHVASEPLLEGLLPKKFYEQKLSYDLNKDGDAANSTPKGPQKIHNRSDYNTTGHMLSEIMKERKLEREKEDNIITDLDLAVSLQPLTLHLHDMI